MLRMTVSFLNMLCGIKIQWHSEFILVAANFMTRMIALASLEDQYKGLYNPYCLWTGAEEMISCLLMKNF